MTDDGHAFIDALCETIDDVTGAAPDAYAHQRADLIEAVRRDLYVSLSNNESLAAAWANDRERGVTVISDLERAVTVQLLPGAHVSVQSAPRPGLRYALGTRRARAQAARPEPRTTSSRVCFLIDHPKFIPFIRPVVNALAQLADVDVTLLSATPDVTRLPDDMPGQLIQVGAHRPRGRGLAAALRERDYLPASYDAIRRRLRELDPTVTVTIEGNSPVDEVLRVASQQAGIPCFCIQHGWSPLLHTGFRRLAYDRMLVWGRGFAEILSQASPSQHFDVTGSIVFDQGARGKDGSHDGIGFFLQPPSRLLPEGALESFLALATSVARTNPTRTVYVREHPAAPLTVPVDAPNVILAKPETHPLVDLLVACRATVSIYSTVLLESIATLTPPVSVNLSSIAHYVPDFASRGAGIAVRDVESALPLITRLLVDEEYCSSFELPMRSFRDEFFDGASPGASERVAALLVAA